MPKRKDYLVIQGKIARGVYIKDIAAELGVHPRTVRRALQRRGAPSGKRPLARRSRLDPFKPTVDWLLAAGVWNAVVILREIEAERYMGEISIVQDYIRPYRARTKGKTERMVEYVKQHFSVRRLPISMPGRQVVGTGR